MTLPPLHLIVPAPVLAPSTFPERAERLQEACGPGLAIHLRAPELPAALLYARARGVAGGAERHGGWCVVNGRADVARAAGAHAVQLGRRAPPLDALRPHLGPGLADGASVHGVREAREAAALGANYLLLGTIYATPSHPGREGAGAGLIGRVDAALGPSPPAPPLVAIGGIDRDRVREVRGSGAAGVAVLRAVWEAPDAVEAAAALLEAWHRAGDAAHPEGTTSAASRRRAGESMSRPDIRIQVNGRPRSVPQGRTLAELLDDLELDPRAVVVELNREIVRRHELGDRSLEPGDQVEVVHFVGGGGGVT